MPGVREALKRTREGRESFSQAMLRLIEGADKGRVPTKGFTGALPAPASDCGNFGVTERTLRLLGPADVLLGAMLLDGIALLAAGSPLEHL